MKHQSPATLTQLTYERLRAEILSCNLKPGELLKINELCLRLSSSTSAVREALSRLAAEGLVIAQPQKRFQVSPISIDDLMDLTSTRIAIEELCLRAALAAGDVDWEASIVASYHRLKRAPILGTGAEARPTSEWMVAHAAFHEALVSACTSVRLRELRRFYELQGERYMRMAMPFASCLRSDELDREHESMMDAAMQRDIERMAVLIHHHLSRTSDVLRSIMEMSDDGSSLLKQQKS